MPSPIFDRFNPANNWEKINFGRAPLQSAELNEIQSIQKYRADRVAGATFKDGTIIEGAEISRLPPGSAPLNLRMLDGAIFIQGGIYDIDGESLTIPLNTRVAVGIRMKTVEVTATQDATLKEPMPGARNFGEPGASRTVSQFRWGWQDNAGHRDGYTTWTFFPIYEVLNGEIQIKAPPDTFSPVRELVARYDRESNGNYIVNGLAMLFVRTTGEVYEFDVQPGTANIFGYKIDRLTSQRLLWDMVADTQSVNNEPRNFIPDLNGKFKFWTNRAPIASVGEVIGTKEKTETITHGVSGGTDILGEASVLQIVEVKQGSTIYTNPASWTPDGGAIDWSPGGAEPAASSTYTVKYRYLVAISPSEYTVTPSYIEFSGLVTNGQIQVDYTYKLPRADLLVMNKDGNFERLKGISQYQNPQPPQPSPDQLTLARVTFYWVQNPIVANIGIKAVPMYEIQEMRNNIFDLWNLMGLERLKTAANSKDAASKYGLFVDNFWDNSQRDEGIPQTGAIGGGVLTIAIQSSDVSDPDGAANSVINMLDFILEVGIEQPSKTACMLINPYQSFAALPAIVKLDPEMDHWTVVNEAWLDPKVVRKTTGAWHPGMTSGPTRILTSIKDVLQSTNSVADEFIQPRDVGFTLEGWGPNEIVGSVLFDGRTVTPTGSIKASGVLTFTGQPTANSTVTLGTRTYTFVAALTSTANQVLLGTSTSETIDRLFAAINGDSGSGSLYSIGTASNTDAEAVAKTTTTITVKALSAGDAANSVATTDTVVAASWGAATLAGGVTGSGVYANEQGFAEGTFTIPPNVPIGVKQVQFHGVSGPTGSNGSAAYLAAGIIETDVLRKVKTIVTWRVDPLAQTFTLTANRMIAAVDFRFCVAGTHNIFVQLRETQLGFPTSDVVAEAIIRPGDILVDGGWTRATFEVPPLLFANREYAVVLLTDDAAASVSIAELGAYVQTGDGPTEGWVTEQPYSVGVLLSSSNASTWTAHQNADLAFRLQVCRFTQSTKTVQLGAVAIQNVTDLQLMATVERTSAATDVTFHLFENGRGLDHAGSEDQSFNLNANVTDTLNFSAVLKGDAYTSPILWPQSQVAVGTANASGGYVSQAIIAAISCTTTVVFSSFKPGNSTTVVSCQVQRMAGGVEVQSGGVYQSDYVQATQVNETPLGDGWVEETWQLTGMRGVNNTTNVAMPRYTRVKIVIVGTPQFRPQVKELRAWTK